jgi:hypothetical protein
MVIGMLTVPMTPAWLRPTDSVEQLLVAGAATATDTEHRLIGASRLRSGPTWVVVFVPVVESSPGIWFPLISLLRTVIGIETGS